MTAAAIPGGAGHRDDVSGDQLLILIAGSGCFLAALDILARGQILLGGLGCTNQGDVVAAHRILRIRSKHSTLASTSHAMARCEVGQRDHVSPRRC